MRLRSRQRGAVRQSPRNEVPMTTIPETDELKACPFCGCHGLSAAYPRIIREQVCGVVECHTDNCYAMVVADTLPKAIAAWNRRTLTRTTPSAASPMVERLQKLIESLEELTPDEMEYLRLLPEAKRFRDWLESASAASITPEADEQKDAYVAIFWSADGEAENVLCIDEREIAGSFKEGVTYRAASMTVSRAAIAALSLKPAAEDVERLRKALEPFGLAGDHFAFFDEEALPSPVRFDRIGLPGDPYPPAITLTKQHFLEARAALASKATPLPNNEPDIFRSVREAAKEAELDGAGFWRTCSGCYEGEDGQNVNGFPHSPSFGCILGGGCHECGGIGATWDTTDYEDMARSMMEEDEATPLDQGLIDALAFYADPETYHACSFLFDRPTGGFDEDFDEDHGHPDYGRPMPGKRARTALEALSVSGGFDGQS